MHVKKLKHLKVKHFKLQYSLDFTVKTQKVEAESRLFTAFNVESHRLETEGLEREREGEGEGEGRCT